MILDPDFLRRLDDARIHTCLIGAAALAVHGFVRSTADVDFLTSDDRVLRDSFWEGEHVQIQRGDPSEPLIGVVRWSGKTGPLLPHDLLVGRGHAAHFALDSAEPNPKLHCLVATPLALVLLKLEAAGTLDGADILGLVSQRRQADGAPWLSGVAAHLPRLSPEARALWKRLQTDLASG